MSAVSSLFLRRRPASRRAPRRLLLAASLVLALSGPTQASPIRVSLVGEDVALEEAGAEIRLVFRDRRGEGRRDLLGWVGAGTEVLADGPDLALAVPTLVLGGLRAAGFSASTGPSSGALTGELLLHRFWIRGGGSVTAEIDVELVLRSAGWGVQLGAWRVVASSTSETAPPHGVEEAVGAVLSSLGSQLAELFSSGGFASLVRPGAAVVEADRRAEPRRAPAVVREDQPERPDGLDGASSEGQVPALRRRVGFGAAARLGFESLPSHGMVEVQGEFLALELRIVASDTVSLDWVADLVGPLAISMRDKALMGIRTALFLHFSTTPSRRVSGAIAPGFGLTVIPDPDAMLSAPEPKSNTHVIFSTFRLGADFSSPGREFGLGVYLVPTIGGVGGYPGLGPLVEVYLEVTWTLYSGFEGHGRDPFSADPP